MIHAAINGKLNGKLNCLQSEDALTAAVFGRLRYLLPSVLGEWLATARNHTDPRATWVPRASEMDVEFWPTVKDALHGRGSVQPDVAIRFDDEVVIVEAKLWSPKSAIEDGLDQLARQWHGTTEHYGERVTVTALVYLTSHLEPPRADLDASAHALGANASVLWWLSWSTLAPILERQVASTDRVSRLVAEDLLQYLREVGVLCFRGWRLAFDWQRGPCWRYQPSRRALYARYWHDYSRNEPTWSYLR